MQISLTQMYPNCVRVSLPPKEVFFSYETVVAVRENNTLYVTLKRYSKTTDKHVEKIVKCCSDSEIKFVRQEELEDISKYGP